MTERLPVALMGIAVALPLAMLPFVMRPELAIAASLGVIGLVLAWISPAIPLGLAGLTTLLVGLGVVPAGSPLSPAIFAWMIAGVAFAIVRSRSEPLGVPLIVTAPVVLSLLLWLLMLVRLPGSWDETYGASKLSLFVTFNLALLVAGAVAARRRRDLDIALGLILTLATVGATALTLELVGGAQPVFDGRYALSGSGDPIELGRASTVGILIALYFLLFRSGPIRIAVFAALPLLIIAELASGSRGPFIGLIVGIAVLVSRRTRAWSGGSPVRLVVSVIVVAGVIASQVAPGTAIDRVVGVFSGGGEGGRSSNGRFDLWTVAWSGFSEHPLAGVGTGGFGALAPGELYPHTLFLEAAVELGILGLLLTVGIVIVCGARLFRRVPGSGRLDHGHMVVVSALFAAAVVNSFFSGDIIANAAIWLALGFGIGVASRSPAEAPVEPTRGQPVGIARPAQT